LLISSDDYRDKVMGNFDCSKAGKNADVTPCGQRDQSYAELHTFVPDNSNIVTNVHSPTPPALEERHGNISSAIDAVRPGGEVVPQPGPRGEGGKEVTNMDSVMETCQRSEVKDGRRPDDPAASNKIRQTNTANLQGPNKKRKRRILFTRDQVITQSNVGLSFINPCYEDTVPPKPQTLDLM
jgi:hypothetical protein